MEGSPPTLVARAVFGAVCAAWSWYQFGDAGLFLGFVVGFLAAPVPSPIRLVRSVEHELEEAGLPSLMFGARAVGTSIIDVLLGCVSRFLLLAIGAAIGAAWGRWGVVTGFVVGWVISIIVDARHAAKTRARLVAEADRVRREKARRAEARASQPHQWLRRGGGKRRG